MTRSPAPPTGFVASIPGDAAIPRVDLQSALAVAHAACDRARAEILPRYRRVAIDHKRDGSPVTEADLAAEKAIRRVIAEAFPGDAILGEEFGETAGAAGDRGAPRRRWVVDPIDGTIAFSRGIPLFTTLVALLVDDEPVVGVIDLPAVDDRIGGSRGGGVWRGSQRLSIAEAARSTPPPSIDRPETPLADALVCHGDLFCFERAGLRPLYDAMSHAIPKLRGYTDAFGHLLVVSGAADAMVDCDLNPWDAAATRLLAIEAGGACWVREREDGRKLDLIFGATPCVQAIGALLDTADPGTADADRADSGPPGRSVARKPAR